MQKTKKQKNRQAARKTKRKRGQGRGGHGRRKGSRSDDEKDRTDLTIFRPKSMFGVARSTHARRGVPALPEGGEGGVLAVPQGLKMPLYSSKASLIQELITRQNIR